MCTVVSIGEFSRLSHLSVKALRHYHEIDLLVPFEIDQSSGYRRYSTAQLGDAHLIRRLRDLTMALPEIKTVLSAEETTSRNRAIVDHLGRVEKKLAQTKDVVESLRSLLADDDSGPIEIEMLWLPPLRVLTASDCIEQQMILEWCGANFKPLFDKVNESGLVPAGPPGGLYGTEVLTQGEGEVTIFVPVLGSPDQLKHAKTETLPTTHVAKTTHIGSYEDLDTTYGQLGTYTNRLGISTPQAVRENYVVGPAHSSDVTEWRTEVCWPITEPTTGSTN